MSSTTLTLIGLCCAGIFTIAFMGGGALLIYRTRQAKAQADASQNWPATIGQVTEASVSQHVQMDSEGDRQDSYTPTVKYVYQVVGQTYIGNKLSFGFQQSHSRRQPAEAALAHYPLGAQVTVYYDPANPQNAVLERKAGGSNMGYIMGGIFILIGLCGICSLLIAVVSALFNS